MLRSFDHVQKLGERLEAFSSMLGCSECAWKLLARSAEGAVVNMLLYPWLDTHFRMEREVFRRVQESVEDAPILSASLQQE
jgi:hypothetical protein